jgi:ribulose-phosphate 3-epimerase
MKTTICPTVTACDLHEYREQLEGINFAQRVHIDLMDGLFAPTTSPELSRIWLPSHQVVDIHLMYQNPANYLDWLIKLRPSMVIIQAEADVHHMEFAGLLHKEGIKVGLAILQDTPAKNIFQIMHSFDHILVFSGDLGRHGGVADLGLLSKVSEIKDEYPEVEIGWDGGINDENAQRLVDGGIDVLNVGGFIQKAADPKVSYEKIVGLLS